ncbi:hypothetical protein [Bordetella sp. FB-8]|uniref:hypothetical protein n=1 Tax=Bordetella sp. FB-8 TaxID=1159870 RepID=UPI00036CA76D|nr:hypothetical protein [Bordetella sp. FB-8]
MTSAKKPAVAKSAALPGQLLSVLLEQSNGEWLDTGAASQAGRSDTTLETVGAINRTQD